VRKIIGIQLRIVTKNALFVNAMMERKINALAPNQKYKLLNGGAPVAL
jgi:hypothetical protein